MVRLLLLAAVSLLVAAQSHAGLIASVEHDDDSVILRFPLYDAAAPEQCASDVTISTTGLEINVSTDVSDGYYDQYRQTDSTLEGITTIGTYATPTATKARFEIIATGACTYELHLENAAFAVTNANMLTLGITDGGTEILDAFYWVDLTPVSSSTLIDALLDTSCTSYATVDDVGYQLCTALNAVLTDTGTTLDNKIDAVAADTAYITEYTGTVGLGSSGRSIVLDEAAPVSDDWFIGAQICIVDADDTDEVRDCSVIDNYAQSSGTITMRRAMRFTIAEDDPLYIKMIQSDGKSQGADGSPICGSGGTVDYWSGEGFGLSGCDT